MLEKVWNWLKKEEPGQSDMEYVLYSILFVAIVTTVFVFLGYTNQTVLNSLNISNVSTLPIVGGLFSAFENAMSVGATAVLLYFLIIIIGALIGVVRYFRTGFAGVTGGERL